jgi:hypothetical protein
MKRYLAENGIRSRLVSEATRVVGAEHRRVASLNDAAALKALRTHAPDLVIYAGGGIIERRTQAPVAFASSEVADGSALSDLLNNKVEYGCENSNAIGVRLAANQSAEID